MGLERVNLSIILPFYNAENTISRAIESIANQSYQNFECILINNNSKDGSLKIAEEWRDKDTRFKLIHEAQQGVVFASNAGLQIAKGKYIARMDADDFSFPDRMKLQVEFLEKNNDYGAVSGQVEYISEMDHTEGFARYVDWVNSVNTYKEILNNRFIESPIINPTAMWRRGVSEKWGMYQNGNFPEDYELWLRWLCNGVKIRKLNEPLIKWYDSPTRLTRTHSIYSNEAFFRIKTQYLADWLKKNNPQYPKVAIWGASRISRKYIGFLKDQGIEIDFFIDIKKSRQISKEVVYYEDIPLPKEVFILVYMKHLKIKNQIKSFLDSKGFVLGLDYLLVS